MADPIIAPLLAVLERLTKLVETRAANREYILEKFLLPLVDSVATLHDDSMKKFTSYRRELRASGITQGLLDEVADDVLQVVHFRDDILIRVDEMRKAAAKRTSKKNNELVKVILALNNYLFPSELQESLMGTSIIEYSNPTYQSMSVAFRQGDKDVALATVTLILGAMETNYREWRLAASKYIDKLSA